MKESIDDDALDLNSENLYISYDAFKTMLDAGVSRAEALKRTGITEQNVRDMELEEEEMGFRDEFKEEWDKFSDDDDEIGGDKWDDDNLDEDDFGLDDDYGFDSNDAELDRY